MKMPRHYAAEFLKAKSREDQVKVWNTIPKEWQDLVRTQINIARMRDA